jgi:hypothetical protein
VVDEGGGDDDCNDKAGKRKETADRVFNVAAAVVGSGFLHDFEWWGGWTRGRRLRSGCNGLINDRGLFGLTCWWLREASWCRAIGQVWLNGWPVW